MTNPWMPQVTPLFAIIPRVPGTVYYVIGWSTAGHRPVLVPLGDSSQPDGSRPAAWSKRIEAQFGALEYHVTQATADERAWDLRMKEARDVGKLKRALDTRWTDLLAGDL